MNDADSGTNLLLGGASVSLTGGGTVTLGNSAYNRIYGTTPADVLTNVNNTIQGSGNIGYGEMALVNQGTIDANQATALTINTSNGTTNTGTLEATAGGSLVLQGDTYTNTNGTILASGTGSVVTLVNPTINGGKVLASGGGSLATTGSAAIDNATILVSGSGSVAALGGNPTINGGTLNTASGGLIQASGNPTLNGVTNSGAYQLLDDGNTTLVGTITNAGGITLSSVGDNTNLIVGSSAVTLTGGGTVTLGNSGSNRIYGAAGSDVLTNANNTIQGSGNIGVGQMGLVNQGTIDANQATALTINTSSGTTNTGTLEATNGANLILQGDTYTNAGGTIQASGTGSVVTLASPTINGGTILASGTNAVVSLQSPTINGSTLNTASGGLIRSAGNPTLSGVTNSGVYQLPNGTSTTLVGTITNTGNIQLNSVGDNTNLILGAAGVTLTGGGTVTLSNYTSNRIYGAVAADVLTLNANNTIHGSGQIGAGGMALVNQGTIDANQAATLTISTSNGTTNTGTLEA